MPDKVTVASAVLHKGEEPLLIGKSGSGAVFFSGCTLGCPFCQNIQISCDSIGTGISVAELTRIFLELQAGSAANINLVTATQFVPSIISAIAEARSRGLDLPLMWNSSGYESLETIEMLNQSIDIWLPDLKTLSSDLAGRLFNAPDYPEAARSALLKMADLTELHGGVNIENGIMKQGMIVRHLVMPGELASSREVLEWFADNLKTRAMLSLMVQYTPVKESGDDFAGPDYVMPDYEYDQLLGWLDEFGIDEGFLQEPEAASAEWIPDFNRINPFPEAYSKPVWHWKNGMI
jgi:putative pyruvate formate lyase activating enzyme